MKLRIKIRKPIKTLTQMFKKYSVLPLNIQDEDEVLSMNITTNEKFFQQIFNNCYDIVFRPVQINSKTKIFLIFLANLVDVETLNKIILKPLIYAGIPQGLGNLDSIGQVFKQQMVAVADTKTVTKVSQVIENILRANVVILADGESSALVVSLKGFAKRSVEEPVNEVSISGPRESFTETLDINTSLLRRKIKSPRLKMESRSVGELSKTEIVIGYIEGITPDSVIEEVRKRIDRIQTDSSSYIEEFIEDNSFSLFPQIQNTERPDVVAASLLEGKVAIFEDGIPLVLLVPMTFWTSFQAAEDYYQRFIYTTCIRLLRILLLNLSLMLPSLYVAVTTFHPQLIPMNLLVSIAAAREGTPFPAVVEALLMEIMFEGLREAGLHLPKPIGAAVSIVGALVIGEAAVRAGIVSSSIVIVVGTTGISSFAAPRYNFGIAFRMLRFPLLILSGTLGLFGTVFGLIAILIHLVNLRSFGIPYFSPVAPQIPSSLKDILIRAPKWSMNFRPRLIVGADKKRIPKGQQPSPKRSNQE